MKTQLRKISLAFALVLPALPVTPSVAADAWPTKPLRMIVPLGAGGNADAVARAVAQRLEARLQSPVIVENRPGAAGNLGIEHAARSPADGHTILFAVTGITINPSLYRVSFDPIRDFAPVIQLNRVYLALFARQGLPATSAADVVALARTRPRAISCASTGGATQLGCALLEVTAGVPIVQVTYKGPVQALTDLASGNVDVLVDTPQAARAMVEAGKIKPIGTSAPIATDTVVGRLKPISDAVKDFVLPGWHGIFAPAGTPPAIVETLNREINQVLSATDMRALFESVGMDVAGGTAADFAALVKADTERYRAMAISTGLLQRP